MNTLSPSGRWLVTLGQFSILLHKRSVLVFCGLAILLFALIVVAMAYGSSIVSPAGVIAVLMGEGAAQEQLIVTRLRLPRALATLFCGAALGGAGCLVQTLARNRLATPESLGQDSGAALIMTVYIIVASTQQLGPWWLASIGAVLVGGLLLLLAGGIGMNGYRVLIVGIGLAALMRSLTELLMSTTNVQHLSVIYNWTLGSFNGQDLGITLPASIALLVLLPFVLVSGRQLALMQFSENVSASLGLNNERARTLVFFLAIFLASLGVGIGGPIPFIALAAPILASRLSGPNTVPVLCSALVGAALVLLADTAGRTLASPGEIPAGVLSSLLGGPFLLWVLFSEKN